MARLAPHLVLLRLLSHTLMAAKLEDDDSADLPAAETQPSPLLPAEQVPTVDALPVGGPQLQPPS